MSIDLSRIAYSNARATLRQQILLEKVQQPQNAEAIYFLIEERTNLSSAEVLELDYIEEVPRVLQQVIDGMRTAMNLYAIQKDSGL